MCRTYLSGVLINQVGVLGATRPPKVLDLHDFGEDRLVYILLVCSQLTYCSPVRCPHLLKDTERLEKVQK